MRAILGLAIPFSFFACSGNNDTCDPVAQSGCDNLDVCEQVVDAGPACFGPVELRGRVIDLADAHGIAGVRVVAVDVNGSAASSVAVTSSDGSYVLPVPAQRAADGTPSAFPVSLRADAAGYLAFPGIVQRALPVDLATATPGGDGLVIASTLTDIGLLTQLNAPAGSIRGKVAVPDDRAGVLVVAESAAVGHAAVAGRDGDYQIFNLPAGHYRTTAYAVGHVYAAAETDVATSTVAVDLALASTAPGSITGQVSIVNGGGASNTSVVAFVESTFDPVTGRGIAPPGLRSPRTGAPDVTGAFAIDGVPPGRVQGQRRPVRAIAQRGSARRVLHAVSTSGADQSSIGSKSAFTAPQSGQLHVSGSLSNGVPGGISEDGSPSAGS